MMGIVKAPLAVLPSLATCAFPVNPHRCGRLSPAHGIAFVVPEWRLRRVCEVSDLFVSRGRDALGGEHPSGYFAVRTRR
jgi:hypothetical protein